MKEKTYILLRESVSDDSGKYLTEFGTYPSPNAAKADIQARKETGKFELVLRIDSFTARTEQMVLFDEPPKLARKKRGPNKPKPSPDIIERPGIVPPAPAGCLISTFDGIHGGTCANCGRLFADHEPGTTNCPTPLQGADAGHEPELERNETILCEASPEAGQWSVDIVAHLYSDNYWGFTCDATLSGAELSAEVTDRFETKEQAAMAATLGIREWINGLPAKLKRGDKSGNIKAMVEALDEVGQRPQAAQEAVPL